jgi:predicted nucleic acid-binding Zn ribbon protein
VFRGSGFYITDYGKDGKGPRKPETEKPAKAPEGSGASGGTESTSKPEPPSSKQATGKGDKKAPKE